MAEKTVETGGRCAIFTACASGTPCAVRPAVSVLGSVLARPAISSEKKMPMDSDIPEFWHVDRMPEATPRFCAGAEDMIAAVLGEANRPEPTPLPKISSANTQYEKSIGSSIRPVKQAAATSSPPVANGRAPYRSDRMPDSGPAIRN